MNQTALETPNGIDSVEIEANTISSDRTSAPNGSHEEHQYLDLIRRILAEGEHRPDRYILSVQNKRRC